MSPEHVRNLQAHCSVEGGGVQTEAQEGTPSVTTSLKKVQETSIRI